MSKIVIIIFLRKSGVFPCNRPCRPIGGELMKIPHFVGNLLTDGG
jgi:hypothetical protein